MTYGEACLKGRKMLEDQGIEGAAADAWYLMEDICGIRRSFYYLHQRESMPEEMRQAYFQAVDRRCLHIPLQYITGRQEFMGLTFTVTPDVLIPRQDTEVLVEEVLKYLKPGMEALDLCTGSGCIGVSLKHYVPGAEIWASDISQKALKVAKKNALGNQAEVHFVHSDMFEHIHQKFDIIVSNPPYIPSARIPELMPEVRDHEPVTALDGSGDGLHFYHKITESSSLYLKEKGMLFYEIGYDQGRAVSEILRENGFENVTVIRDLAGLDRVVAGRRK